MDFLDACEDLQCSEDDTFYTFTTADSTGFDSACDEGFSLYDTAPDISFKCEELGPRQSDLELAKMLDDLACSFRSGSSSGFMCETASAGQSLQDFLCHLEKKILEKQCSPQKRITRIEDICPQEPDCCEILHEALKSKLKDKTASSRRRSRSPLRRIFGGTPKRDLECVEVTPEPDCCDLHQTLSRTPHRRGRTPQRRLDLAPPKRETSVVRLKVEPPPSPDWRALNDTNEIICCSPTDQRNMYGLTAGDIWRRRAEERDPCANIVRSRSPSRSRTPVRQVKAVPVTCVPSPKFELEEDCITPEDCQNPEYYGCTVEEILRRKKQRGRSPERKQRVLWCSPAKSEGRSTGYDSPRRSTSRTSICTCCTSRSSSNVCCCDMLPQRVASWMEDEFGQKQTKGVGTSRDPCPIIKDKKPPILKRKPSIGKKKYRVTFPDPDYESFVEGLHRRCLSSPITEAARRLPDQCVLTKEAIAYIRELDRQQLYQGCNRRIPVVVAARRPGLRGNSPPPQKLHLVKPPEAFYEIDEIDDVEC